MPSQAIIFIPGTKGTQLEDRNTFGHDIIWRDLRFNINPVQNLHLTEDLGSGYYENKMDSIIGTGSLEGIVYKEFIKDLWPQVPKYLFNYDWRMPNKQSAKKLHQFIEMLKKKSIAAHAEDNKVAVIKKVDIIIHSQGNHVLRHFINDNGFNSINKAVFVAPPFLGSLEMVQAMLCGQGFLWSKEKTRKIVRTFPGSFELLPTYECAAQFHNGKHVDFFNYSHWQQSKGIIANKAKFTKLLQRAKKANNAIHTGWLSTLTKAEKKNILVIVKDGFKTMQKLKVDENNKNEVDFKHAIKETLGDKIVPHVSSCVYADQLTTLKVKLAPWQDDKSHAYVLKSERVQRLINRFLSGNLDITMPGKHIEKVTTPYKVTCNE